MSRLMKVIPGDRIVLVDTDLLTHELQIGSSSYNENLSDILESFENVQDYWAEAPENGQEIYIKYKNSAGQILEVSLTPCDYTGIWEMGFVD